MNIAGYLFAALTIATPLSGGYAQTAQDAGAATEYRSVDPEDVSVGPGKFSGKPIELKSMRCFYADVADYRCIAAKGGVDLMINAGVIDPTDEEKKLEEDCGAIKNVATKACVRVVRLTYVQGDVSHDIISGYRKRTLISVKEMTISRPAQPTRKRRR